MWRYSYQLLVLCIKTVNIKQVTNNDPQNRNIPLKIYRSYLTRQSETVLGEVF